MCRHGWVGGGGSFIGSAAPKAILVINCSPGFSLPSLPPLLPGAVHVLTLGLELGQDSPAAVSSHSCLGLLCCLRCSDAPMPCPLRLYSTVLEQLSLPYFISLVCLFVRHWELIRDSHEPFLRVSYTLSPGLVFQNLPLPFFIQIRWKRARQVAAFRASL